MKRIKDFSKITLRGDMLLLKVNVPTKSIIMPAEAIKNNFDYATVIAAGQNIEDVKVGDIVVDIDGPVTHYTIEKDGEKITYVRTPRHNCAIIVSPDNFDITTDTSKNININ